MHKTLLTGLTLILMIHLAMAQDCQITEITATPGSCTGNYFNVTINLTVNNPSSQGFTLAGNGIIYGTFLYSDLPVNVGPLLGDDESQYEFIAWDVENPACQNYTTLLASNCGPICGFSNASLELISCLGNASALVDFDVDYHNVTNAAFDLFYENGSEVGSYLYSSLPVTIPWFIVNGAAPIVLTICDNNNADCCETFTFDAIDCNPSNCEIFNVVADPECTGNNFIVHLNFEFDNPASDSFTVEGNSIFYGTFAYTDLPLTLGPLNGNSNINWEFNIADVVNPSCQQSEVLGVYHCPPPCDILSLSAVSEQCNADTSYSLLLGMEFEGQSSTGFSVFSENYFYGNYAYNTLPLTLPSFDGSGEFIDTVTVCDHDQLGCCETTSFEALLCAGCLIYNLEVVALPCNDADQFMVQLDFDHNNTSDQFTVIGNSMNYGTFFYDDLPVLVGPFNGDGSQFLEFVITDFEDPLCFAATEIGTVGCNDICELTNLTVTTGDCTGNDAYSATINFDFQGTTNIGFDLYVNGAFYHFYSYDDLPLTLNEFPSDGDGEDEITVCENDNNNCCASLAFPAPECTCQLFETTVTVLDCTSDSTFGISLEFFTEHAPNNFIDVYIDGVYHGNYNAENLPVIINDIPEGDGQAILTVCVNDVNTCCDNAVFELINCETPVCGISELIAEPGDCNSDSTYVLDFDFNYQYIPSDSINVFANGTLVGKYKITEPFNRIENFPTLENDTIHFVICAVDDPGCCADYGYIAPDCDFFGQCHIYDMHGIVGDCQSDSAYNLHIEFSYDNFPGDTVHVYVEGEDFGIYPINGGSIFLNNVPAEDTGLASITICALDNENCCGSVQVEIPDCSGFNDCHLFNLIADPIECTSDSTYNLFIDYTVDNFPGDSVTVTINGSVLGTFAHQEEGIQLLNVPAAQSNISTVTVCAVDAPDCCDSFLYETLECGQGVCHIFDLLGIVGDCQSDSTYTLYLLFQFDDLPGDSVHVVANENDLGNFAVNGGLVTLENFPVYNANHTVISVCALGTQDCCDVIEFETPSCEGGGTCHIYDLEAFPGDCNSDSTYALFIHYFSNNIPSDSVIVEANGHYIGTFAENFEGILLNDFQVYGEEFTHITVCAVGMPNCCDDITFNTPTCNQACSIFNIIADPGDCQSDSTFAVLFNLQWEDVQGGFDVYAGEQYLGYFTFDQVPIAINNFPSNSTGNYAVTICESDHLDCCTTQEFNGPTCGGGGDDCQIYDLVWTQTDCDSSGHFYFILDFEFDHVGNSGFTIHGNGNEYGVFSYDSLPVTLGPFEEGDTDWEFGISDVDHADCGAVTNPGVVDCIVATENVLPDDYFAIFNNGTIPGILAKQDVVISLFNANGKAIVQSYNLGTNKYFEMNNVADGFYIVIIDREGHIWPVKLIKTGN